MCIIVAKPAGIDIPSKEIFENCALTNRDGIGFSFNKTGENPIICKGFANVKKLFNMIDTFNIGKEHNLMVHFRLATHGKSDQGNCHPFPLSQSFDDLRLLHCTCNIAISHNGIFGGMPSSEKYSDTQKFISNIIASPEIVDNLDSMTVKELIKGYCGHSSKLAFLKPSGFSLVGDFELDEGVHYSNRQYKSWNNHYNHNHHNHHRGEKYCTEHEKWDKCAEQRRKEGKTWCYIHKEYDFCTWCSDHKEYDMCHHDAKQSSVNLPIIIGEFKKCQYCNIESNMVRYDNSVQADLCDECSSAWNNQGIIRSVYYD